MPPTWDLPHQLRDYSCGGLDACGRKVSGISPVARVSTMLSALQSWRGLEGVGLNTVNAQDTHRPPSLVDDLELQHVAEEASVELSRSRRSRVGRAGLLGAVGGKESWMAPTRRRTQRCRSGGRAEHAARSEANVPSMPPVRRRTCRACRPFGGERGVSSSESVCRELAPPRDSGECFTWNIPR